MNSAGLAGPLPLLLVSVLWRIFRVSLAFTVWKCHANIRWLNSELKIELRGEEFHWHPLWLQNDFVAKNSTMRGSWFLPFSSLFVFLSFPSSPSLHQSRLALVWLQTIVAVPLALGSTRMTNSCSHYGSLIGRIVQCVIRVFLHFDFFVSWVLSDLFYFWFVVSFFCHFLDRVSLEICICTLLKFFYASGDLVFLRSYSELLICHLRLRIALLF